MYTRAAADQPAFDWAGSAVLASGLTLTILALRTTASAAWWLGAGAAVLLVLFPLCESRAASPVVDFSLFRRGAFLGGSLIIALQNMAMYPLLFQLPVFFDRVRSSGARAMGQALLALTVAMMVSSVLGGRLTELIGARAQTFAGSILALAGMWWFADFESVRMPYDVIPGMLLIGVGVGITSPPAQAASMSTIGPGQSGMAGGVVSTLRYMGAVAGTTALGALLRDSASPASHQRPVFIYAGALVVAAALSFLLPGRPRKS
jgi:predicted MFS family arabinose efflux permease